MGNLVFDPFKMFISNNSASSDEFATFSYQKIYFSLIIEESFFGFFFWEKEVQIEIFSLPSELRPQ